MSNGQPGRPLAEALAARCTGKNKAGARCKNPPMRDLEVCPHHLTAADRKTSQSLAERLRMGGDEAVAKLRELIRTGSDEVACRAAEILLSRVAPKLSSRDAVVVHVNDMANPAGSAAKRLEARMALLAAASRPDESADAYVDAESEARAQQEDLAWKSAPPDDEVVEAELVPEPVVRDQQPAAPRPYGVPPTSRRPGDLQRLAEQHAAWTA